MALSPPGAVAQVGCNVVASLLLLLLLGPPCWLRALLHFLPQKAANFSAWVALHALSCMALGSRKEPQLSAFLHRLGAKQVGKGKERCNILVLCRGNTWSSQERSGHGHSQLSTTCGVCHEPSSRDEIPLIPAPK